MLKVIGASWQKTRIGTYILIGAGLLVIGAFFISYMERPKYDGTYCATAFWTNKVGFQVEYWKQQNDLLNIPKGAARICYKDSIFENGWAQIEVETQRSFPDWVQAYGAGMLEGSLTWNSIYNQWQNTIDSSCNRDESSQNFCAWLRELLTDNYERTKEHATLRAEHDHYWHQIALYFNQLEGLETGYMRGAKRARSDLEEEIPFSDFLLMNAAADIQDLKVYYENFVLRSNETDQTPRNFHLPSATMLTRIFRTGDSNAWRLLFGHSTAASYASMLRIQKRYKFHYHFTPNQRTNTVPGVDITFTGYPGILASTDDFYMVKGRQVQSIVAGVSIKNANLDLWRVVKVEEAVPLAARVMAANRMAQNRRTWAKAMTRHPFTGAKQWITVDLNKLGVPSGGATTTTTTLAPSTNAASTSSFDELNEVVETTTTPAGLGDTESSSSSPPPVTLFNSADLNKGMVWIIEQLPGRMHIKDVTESFIGGGDGPGNSIWLANGLPYFDEALEASGQTREGQEALPVGAEVDLNNLEAVDKFLRLRAFRGDLMGDGAEVPYGNIDIKLFSYNARIGMSDYQASAGPVFLRLQYSTPHSNDATQVASEDSFTAIASRENLASALRDERLSVTIDETGGEVAELAELEAISERRSVRNDMRAIAMRQASTGPFRWSAVRDKMAGVEHQGHPDEWNFGHVSPKWAW